MWKIDQLLSLVAPFDCFGCGQEADVLCPDCVTDLPGTIQQCYKCRNRSADPVCRDCDDSLLLSNVWVATNYTGTSTEVVAALKFQRAQAAARVIAEALHQRLPRLPAEVVVTYIPTAQTRVRQRGYDQARLIARALATYRQLPCSTTLWRTGNTRQVGANRTQRLEQLQTSLHCYKPGRVLGKRLLIVDDVLTTGATIETAARILKQAGALEVSAALFAQKV
jgi:ComF family protein